MDATLTDDSGPWPRVTWRALPCRPDGRSLAPVPGPARVPPRGTPVPVSAGRSTPTSRWPPSCWPTSMIPISSCPRAMWAGATERRVSRPGSAGPRSPSVGRCSRWRLLVLTVVAILVRRLVPVRVRAARGRLLDPMPPLCTPSPATPRRWPPRPDRCPRRPHRSHGDHPGPGHDPRHRPDLGDGGHPGHSGGDRPGAPPPAPATPAATTPPAAPPATTPPATTPPAATTPGAAGSRSPHPGPLPVAANPGVQIQFLPISDAPSPGFYGNTTFTWGHAGGTSVLYVYPGETVQRLAAITAFEIGHEVDAAGGRARRAARHRSRTCSGIHPASWAPNCDCAEQGFLSGWYAGGILQLPGPPASASSAPWPPSPPEPCWRPSSRG